MYSLFTLSEICNKKSKEKALQRALAKMKTEPVEENIVWTVKIWGKFNPDTILKQIDQEWIGERCFDELVIIVKELQHFNVELFEYIDIVGNGMTLLHIINGSLRETKMTLLVDMNEYRKNLHLEYQLNKKITTFKEFSTGMFFGVFIGAIFYKFSLGKVI